jgi:hypothetical protein
VGEGLRRDKRAGTAYRARLPIDLATGQPIRRDTPTRYERERPGELIHVDIKKLGRIPTAAAGAPTVVAATRTRVR